MASFSGIFTRTYPLWWLLVSPEDGNMPIITHCSVFHYRALLKVLNPGQGALHGPTPLSLPHLAPFTPGSPLRAPHASRGAERGCQCILTLTRSQRGEVGTLSSTAVHLSMGALRAASCPSRSASLDHGLSQQLRALLNTVSVWGCLNAFE